MVDRLKIWHLMNEYVSGRAKVLPEGVEIVYTDKNMGTHEVSPEAILIQDRLPNPAYGPAEAWRARMWVNEDGSVTWHKGHIWSELPKIVGKPG